MNWLDIAILVIIALFALIGIKRGFIKGTLSFLAVVVGIVVGIMFHEIAGSLLLKKGIVGNESIASVVGFFVVALAIYLVIQLIAWLLTKLVGTLHLSLIDRMAGGFLGLVIGIIVIFFLISALGFFYSEDEPPFKDSVVVPYVNITFEIIKSTVPDDFKEHLQNTRKIIQKEGMKAILRVTDVERVKEVFIDDRNKPKEIDKK
ncbi:MAG: CvpA family protein [Deltaproteobacteria bacterium]|nr:CvpA family protein [Deltaproteobacteria bacterium]